MSGYKVELLDSSNNVVGIVRNMIPLDNQGTVLKFEDYLSNYGTCIFRIKLLDPIVATNIYQPFSNHVRIKRNNTTVWQGIITDNPRRTKEFIEIEASTYMFLLTRIQVTHDTTGDIDYRSFATGTMSSVITTIFNEGKNRANSPISSMTIGTITNPNYPTGFGADAGKAWNFSATYTMKFDWKSLFHAVSQFANITNADFEVTTAKVFNFKPTIGEEKKDIFFYYGARGSIEDFNAPLWGKNSANQIAGIAADKDTNLLKLTEQDQPSITANGLFWDVIAYDDILTTAILKSRIQSELKERKRFNGELALTLSEKAVPFGTYSLGDSVGIKIKTGLIDISGLRRVIGWKISVHNTGKETVNLITNIKEA